MEEFTARIDTAKQREENLTEGRELTMKLDGG
jgi:hypothetical protein